MSDPTRTKSCLRALRGYLGGQIDLRPPHTFPRIESIPRSKFRFLGCQYCSNVWLFILNANLLTALVNSLNIQCSVKDLNLSILQFPTVNSVIIPYAFMVRFCCIWGAKIVHATQNPRIPRSSCRFDLWNPALQPQNHRQSDSAERSVAG